MSQALDDSRITVTLLVEYLDHEAIVVTASDEVGHLGTVERPYRHWAIAAAKRASLKKLGRSKDEVIFIINDLVREGDDEQ